MDAVTRVLKTINHEEPDRVPAFESAFTNDTIRKHYGFDTGSGAAQGLAAIQKLPNPMETARYFLSNRDFQTKGYSDAYKFLRKVKIDIGLSLITQMPRIIIEGGMIDEYGRIMMLEPAKEDGTIILGYRGGHFKNFEDYENWERPDPDDPIRMDDFLAGKDVQKQMENEIFSVPAIAGMMEVGWEPFGLEVFSRILARPKQAMKVFDDQGKLALEITKILAENNAQMILIWDDYGYKNGLFMSPENYRTYVFPWLRKICAAAHKHDCKILLHSDGDLITIFDDIINCGVDALNPIDPTTVNPDYDIFKLYPKYGDKITFVGNISPIMLALGTIKEIKEYSKRLIFELGPGGGFIFSSGHSINPAISVDRWEAVMEIREKYGSYPIQAT